MGKISHLLICFNCCMFGDHFRNICGVCRAIETRGFAVVKRKSFSTCAVSAILSLRRMSDVLISATQFTRNDPDLGETRRCRERAFCS